MSRSYKKHPVHPVACSKSERWDKKFWHSRYRHHVKQYIKNNMLLDDDWDMPIAINDIAEVWVFNKDGKVLFYNLRFKTRKNIFKNEISYVCKYGLNKIRIITIKELYQWFGK